MTESGTNPPYLQPFYVQKLQLPQAEFYRQSKGEPFITPFPVPISSPLVMEPFDSDEHLIHSTTFGSGNMYKAVKNLGDFGNFLRMLLLGFFCPIIGAIFVFALETTHLSRYGVTLGTANAFLWFGTAFISLDILFSRISENNQIFDRSGQILLWVAAGFLICAIVLYLVSISIWKKFIFLYRSDLAEDVRVKVSSPLGTKCQCYGSFIISFFIPVLGSVLALIMSRSLYSRKGALMGFATIFTLIGLTCVPTVIGYVTGNAALIIGVTLIECTYVHFKRAIASAESEELYTIEFE